MPEKLNYAHEYKRIDGHKKYVVDLFCKITRLT